MFDTIENALQKQICQEKSAGAGCKCKVKSWNTNGSHTRTANLPTSETTNTVERDLLNFPSIPEETPTPVKSAAPSSINILSILPFLVRPTRSDSDQNSLEHNAMAMDYDPAQHANSTPSPSEGTIGTDGWLGLHDPSIWIIRDNVIEASNDGNRNQDRVLLSPCGGEPPHFNQNPATCHPGGNTGVGLEVDDQDRCRAETTS